ncbi:ichor-like [Artemia franciscana]|uniref:C2H2-type domain-containing protein n=1 Tax=Artemia franciscana TaxID=6661 RepID=A0AA88L571_ARTSF|nr:hypothetical protein QYM36_004781 [Artemia franciscana]KAK2719068.1 hypothetical protein QYM36_004781 [Artemia franciscana]
MKGFSSNIDCSDLVSSTTSSLVRGMRFDNQIPVPVDSIFSWGCDPEDILANKFGICDIVVDSTTNGDSKPNSLGINGIEGLLLTVAPSLVQPNNTGSSGTSSSFAELKPLSFDFNRLENSDLINEQNNNSVLVNNNNCSTNNNNSKTVVDVSLNLFKGQQNDNNNNNELFFGDSVSTTVMEGLGSVVQELAQKEEAMGYLTPEIDDIAALIGTAIADSTAQQQRTESSHPLPQVPEGPLIDRDPWADIDNWIENAFSKNEPSDSDSSDLPSLSSCSHNPVTSTLHSLLTKGSRSDSDLSTIKIEPAIDMPLLHGRLISGRNDSKPSISYDLPSCSLARKDSMPHTTFGTHVSTTLPHMDSFSRRQIPKIKDVNLLEDFGSEKLSKKSKLKSKLITSSSPTQSYLETGKEKPLHRCNICNRGFLNKSNIKVHLRTHTGEKPFKCEHCAKAFRQKAHLLKHMQIHKRISRD